MSYFIAIYCRRRIDDTYFNSQYAIDRDANLIINHLIVHPLSVSLLRIYCIYYYFSAYILMVLYAYNMPYKLFFCI